MKRRAEDHDRRVPVDESTPSPESADRDSFPRRYENPQLGAPPAVSSRSQSDVWLDCRAIREVPAIEATRRQRAFQGFVCDRPPIGFSVIRVRR